MTPDTTNHSWEEFDELLPLSFFATENYPGKPEDGELAFSMWQEQQTNRAKTRRDSVYKAFRNLLSSREASLRKKVEVLEPTCACGGGAVRSSNVNVRRADVLALFSEKPE